MYTEAEFPEIGILFRDDDDGTHVGTMAGRFPGIHGMQLRIEDGTPYLYAAHLPGKQAVKLRLGSGPFDKSTPYRLVLRDVDTDAEVQSVPVVIDRSFDDDLF